MTQNVSHKEDNIIGSSDIGSGYTQTGRMVKLMAGEVSCGEMW